MNGVHDMGGMDGLGPIVAERDEPVFHARWEARVLALTLAIARWGRWTLDASRFQRERNGASRRSASECSELNEGPEGTAAKPRARAPVNEETHRLFCLRRLSEQTRRRRACPGAGWSARLV